ncbi:MAG: excinuclease ABC subunit A [Pseudomonadota bacterium]
MSHETAVTWLKAVSIYIIVAGLGFAGAIILGADILLAWFLDLAIWPLDGAQRTDLTEIRMLTAIAGGLTAGLGVMQWLITTLVYARDPETGRKILLAGIIIWFVVDGAGSIAAGAPFNAALNLVFFVPFVIPLLAARPDGARVAT